MFCYQCEQTAKGTGCTVAGVCGKDHRTAVLQDVLAYLCKQIGAKVREAGKSDRKLDRFVTEALFTTVTNVNFDPARIEKVIRNGEILLAGLEKTGRKSSWPAGKSLDELVELGEKMGIEDRRARLGADVAGLHDLLLFGLKGTAAYADHAMILGKESDEVYAFFNEALAFLAAESRDVDELLRMNMRCGEVNLKVMGLLDSANTGAYGNPVPVSVRVEPLKGKAILISGHDLKDLEELLKQTEGRGINIYTHGEMLPAHGYPGLKKYKHLAGNYGGAWQDQQKEFDAFPGAILMTTNCIQKPRETYKGRIFTSGLVAWPGVTHIADRNFAPVIDAALKAEGFKADGPGKTIMVGFGHNAVLGVADKVVAAVKAGKIKHFFLIGGCDGARTGRNYYTEFAEAVPKDCVILTLACGKYRFNKKDFGAIDGIPRLLDCGQCNDAYSAIQIAVALAGAFKTDVNSLPLSLVLSWYEQKAVCILLTLLHLGIKNIRLGPSLPAFVTPAVLKVLVDKFGIRPISNVKDDLKAILG